MRSKYGIFIVISLIIISCVSSSNVSAESSSDPLIYSNNLVYQGAFRVPVGDFGATGTGGFSYGGGAVTYNPANNSLIMLGHQSYNRVAEINIPTPKIPNSSTDLSNLNKAVVRQNFSDITEGNRTKIGLNGAAITNTNVYIGGLLEYNSKLIGTSFTYYPGDTAVLSHFTSGLTLATTGDFTGMFKVGDLNSSFYSGWMTKVPTALQASLGGPALTGNGALSIISRTSSGPSAFSFDPDKLGVDTPVTATPLLYYPSAHPTLGPGETASTLFNLTTKIAGISMVNGSRSVLFFGYHGIGDYNYGQWSTDPIFADTCRAPDTCITGPRGWPICADKNNCTTGRKGIPYDTHTSCPGSPASGHGCYYDPSTMGDKGPHAYPYIYQVWAYDANDLAAVKSGTKNPWDVMPYATWEMPFAVASTALFGGAAAYDALNSKLYIVEPQGDRVDIGNKMPLIHVFQVDLTQTPSASYKIKSKVLLLNGTVVLNNNGKDTLTVNSTNRSTIQEVSFPISVAPGGSYNVTVAKQPDGQSCTVLHGNGVVNANSDVSNVVVYCNNIPMTAIKPPANLQGTVVK